MSGSSPAPEATVTVLKVVMLSIILVPSLTLLSGNMVTPLNTLWGVCGLVFGAATLNAVWRHRALVIAERYDAETTQLLTEQTLSDLTPPAVRPGAFTHSITRALTSPQVHPIPLTAPNKIPPEAGELDGHGFQSVFPSDEGSEDGCASPPMFKIEIFVHKERIVVCDPRGTSSALILDHELPGMLAPGLTELTKRCEATTIQSNLRPL